MLRLGDVLFMVATVPCRDNASWHVLGGFLATSSFVAGEKISEEWPQDEAANQAELPGMRDMLMMTRGPRRRRRSGPQLGQGRMGSGPWRRASMGSGPRGLERLKASMRSGLRGLERLKASTRSGPISRGLEWLKAKSTGLRKI